MEENQASTLLLAHEYKICYYIINRTKEWRDIMKKREDGKNSQTVAKNAYNTRNYDRIAIQVNKGERERLKEFASKNGESVNGLVNRLLADAVPNFVPIGTENQTESN